MFVVKLCKYLPLAGPGVPMNFVLLGGMFI